jgi:hypothetical protein
MGSLGRVVDLTDQIHRAFPDFVVDPDNIFSDDAESQNLKPVEENRDGEAQI